EPIVVRLPFEARRLGWKWRLIPPQVALRSASRTFSGDVVSVYQDAPHLIYGASGTMAELRLLMRHARVYIIAVAQEVQKRSMLAAVSEPGADSAARAPAADAEPAGPDKPAPSVEELQRLFDPNAPAVDLPADATAPAIDPNAPAVAPDPPGA